MCFPQLLVSLYSGGVYSRAACTKMGQVSGDPKRLSFLGTWHSSVLCRHARGLPACRLAEGRAVEVWSRAWAWEMEGVAPRAVTKAKTKAKHPPGASRATLLQSRQILAGSTRIPGMEPPQASPAGGGGETSGASLEGRGL